MGKTQSPRTGPWRAGETEEKSPAVQADRRTWHSGGQVMKNVTGRGNDHLCSVVSHVK